MRYGRRVANRGNSGWPWRLGLGVVIGTGISTVENAAFEGDLSSNVIGVLLLAASAVIGFVWGLQGWGAAIASWGVMPLVHAIKNAFGLPDTLNPNTVASIVRLAGSTSLWSAIGFGCGALAYRIRMVDPKKGPTDPS